ncbi:MAG: branched chain amino acid aminotransferase [Candidatus Binatia bacterium]|nr:MAG: branched chain amino acid aminotransferase [Candidatus Binatia bacterium]
MERTEYIWLDGQFVAWDEARVHVLTHTLHYGLGVFEGIRCYEGTQGQAFVFRLSEHVERLFASAHILGIRIPFARAAIEAACVETIRINRLRSGYIRPLVFLGDGEMGLAAVHNPVRVAIAAWPWGAYLGEEGLRNGVRLKTSSFQRMHVNTFMTKAKAVGNYVNSILAAIEARRAGFDEAMMLDTDGFVAECSGENLFVVRRGVVKTPPLTSVLEGITRASVLTLLEGMRVRCVEERFTRDEAYIADEVFMTGTAAEVTPVREIDGRVIGDGSPGPITRALQEQFHAIVKGEVAEYRHWLTPVP